VEGGVEEGRGEYSTELGEKKKAGVEGR